VSVALADLKVMVKWRRFSVASTSLPFLSLAPFTCSALLLYCLYTMLVLSKSDVAQITRSLSAQSLVRFILLILHRNRSRELNRIL